MTPMVTSRHGSLQPRSGPCLIMGVLNVTPDSFSDGGSYLDLGRAVEHAEKMWALGADIIDVGGESTRPGSERTTQQDEMSRVLPVVRELVARDMVVSVDTTRARVACAAVAAGATLVNDVSGGRADADMPRAVAELGAPYVVGHWRAPSKVMQLHAHYDDVVAEVCHELGESVRSLLEAGASSDQIIIDPGLGFAKLVHHNWRLITSLERLRELGYPLMVGASRKAFLGALSPQPTTALERDLATATITAMVAEQVSCVRVHEVAASARALRALRDGSEGDGTLIQRHRVRGSLV